MKVHHILTTYCLAILFTACNESPKNSDIRESYAFIDKTIDSKEDKKNKKPEEEKGKVEEKKHVEEIPPKNTTEPIKIADCTKIEDCLDELQEANTSYERKQAIINALANNFDSVEIVGLNNKVIDTYTKDNIKIGLEQTGSGTKYIKHTNRKLILQHSK